MYQQRQLCIMKQKSKQNSSMQKKIRIFLPSPFFQNQPSSAPHPSHGATRYPTLAKPYQQKTVDSIGSCSNDAPLVLS